MCMCMCMCMYMYRRRVRSGFSPPPHKASPPRALALRTAPPGEPKWLSPRGLRDSRHPPPETPDPGLPCDPHINHTQLSKNSHETNYRALPKPSHRCTGALRERATQRRAATRPRPTAASLFPPSPLRRVQGLELALAAGAAGVGPVGPVHVPLGVEALEQAVARAREVPRVRGRGRGWGRGRGRGRVGARARASASTRSAARSARAGRARPSAGRAR